MSGLSTNNSSSNLKIVKTDIKPSGEAVQLVRPLIATNKSTDQIVGDLVNRFDYKTKDVKAAENELNTVQQAFGSNLAQELIQSYDGSNLVADSQQDLVGERYLAEQIRLIQEQQRTTSVLDKWGHLLYEGEKDYVSASKTDIPPINIDEQNYGSSATLEQQQAQEQAQYIQQLQQIQEQQRQQLLRQQQIQEQIEQQQMRHSQSQNLAHSNSYQRAASVASTLPAGYVHSQSGLNGRTLSDIKLSQSKANQLATAQYRAQYDAQMEAMTKSEVIAQAYAQAQAEFAAQSKLGQSQSDAYAQIQQEQQYKQQQQQQQLLQQLQQQQQEQEQENLRMVYSRQSAESAPNQTSPQLANKLKKSVSGVQQQNTTSTKFSNSNLKSITIDAYNSPQFKEMLEQLTKPLTVAPEQVNYPPEWPSQDKINLLAEPIYIPAPNPIVIPAPNILNLQNYSEQSFKRNDLDESSIKPTVSYYPPLDNNQVYGKNSGFRQLNLDERTMYQQQ